MALIKRVTKQGTQWNEITRTLFFHVLSWDVSSCPHQPRHGSPLIMMVLTADSFECFPAIFASRDSVFDDMPWLLVRSLGCRSNVPEMARLDTPLIHDTINAFFIQLPRLVRLVRRAREAPESSTVRAEAEALALKLYMLDLEPCIQQARETGLVTIILSESPEYRETLPVSFAFVSFLLSRLCVTYWTMRVLVCGLILALSEIVPAMPELHAFDPEKVVAQDVHAAECISMCYDYLIRSPSPIRLNSVWLMLPLQTGFGAWYRKGKRAAVAGLEAEHAQRMMRMSIRMLDDIGETWGGRGVPASVWVQRSDVLTGGPLPS